MSEHQCPAPGCEIKVPSSRFGCPGHWFALPGDLRREIWSTYKQRAAKADGAVGRHLRAVAAGIEWLKEHQP